LVRPPEYITASIVRVSFEGETLRCYFPEKRDDFRKIVKAHHLMWRNPYWVRKVAADETRTHRAAELIHSIIAAGFCVKGPADVIRMATEGAYQAEPRRMIFAITDPNSKYPGWFRFWWHENEDYYHVAQKLPGARYYSPYPAVVPPDSFEEVLDFAERYDFALSVEAQRAADEARAELESAIVVDVEAPARPEAKRPSGKPPVLHVPEVVEIADDLYDD
jgi:hypothetical protein